MILLRLKAKKAAVTLCLFPAALHKQPAPIRRQRQPPLPVSCSPHSSKQQQCAMINRMYVVIHPPLINNSIRSRSDKNLDNAPCYYSRPTTTNNFRSGGQPSSPVCHHHHQHHHLPNRFVSTTTPQESANTKTFSVCSRRDQPPQCHPFSVLTLFLAVEIPSFKNRSCLLWCNSGTAVTVHSLHMSHLNPKQPTQYLPDYYSSQQAAGHSLPPTGQPCSAPNRM